MSRGVRKIPVLLMVAYVIMIVGVLLFALTPLFLKYLKLDTDIVGLLIAILGLAVLIVGQLVRVVVKKIRSRD